MTTASDLATEGLLSQEIESLAGCIARGQSPETYQDIVAKVRGHAEKLPVERRAFWAEQVQSLGVVLFPPLPPEEPKKQGKSTKPEASSKP